MKIQLKPHDIKSLGLHDEIVELLKILPLVRTALEIGYHEVRNINHNGEDIMQFILDGEVIKTCSAKAILDLDLTIKGDKYQWISEEDGSYDRYVEFLTTTL